MILSNFKSINKKFYKKILLLSPIIIVIYSACVNINYNMMDRYSFFDKLTPYDIYYFIINDPLIELTINIPILLFFLINIINSENYSIISRFNSKADYINYKMGELIYINLIISILFTLTIYSTSYLLTSNHIFNLYDYKGPISLVFNNNKVINKNTAINKYTFILINYYMFFIRNLFISVIMLTITKFINLVFSFMITIFPFMVSAWMNGNLVHFFILDVININNTIGLVVKLIFITFLYILPRNVYHCLEERKIL